MRHLHSGRISTTRRLTDWISCLDPRMLRSSGASGIHWQPSP
nr:MAG TPA: hypothetical protein [Caudoviricetes sp.]